MRSTALMGLILTGLLLSSGPHSAQTFPEENEQEGSSPEVTDEGFPLIETTQMDPVCLQECLPENQHVSVGYEEIERRCRESCDVTRALQLVQSHEPKEYAEGISILCDSDDRRAVGPLIAALRWDVEERTGQWARIIPALGALGDSSAVPILVETLKIPDEDWLGREMSARALGESGDPLAMEELTAHRNDPDPTVARCLAGFTTD